MVNKKQDKELKKEMTNLVKGAVHTDDSLISKFLASKMTSVKTRKTTGAKQAVTNACFVVRLANHVGVEHELISRYYEGDSGINNSNDLKALIDISQSLVGMSCSHAEDYAGMIEVATAFVDSQDTKPKASTETQMPKINFGKAVTLDDIEDDEEEEATATETSYVLDEFNLDVVQMLQAVTVEEIAQAKEVLHNTNKNGEGYEMTQSKGKDTLDAKTLNTRIDWDSQLMRAGADILCISPQRRKKWTADNGKTYKTRSWFPELCGAKDYNKAKMLTERMTAYVILNSKRNFWTARFAWSVSDDFREAWRALIGINEEVADSKVIGGQAQSWHWPLVKNDWTPTSSSKMTDDEFYNLDITSLDTL
jgi:hypothetical protein